MAYRKVSDRTPPGIPITYYSTESAKLLNLDPLAIFGADLVAWYKADNIIATNGKVSQWLDKSGNNFHATQPTPSLQPSWVLNGFNNKPVVKIDYLDVWLSMPNCLSTNWGEASLFIVFNLKDRSQHWDAMRTGSNTTSYWGTSSAFSYHGYFGEFRASRLESLPLNMTIAGQHFLEVVSGVGIGNYKVFRNGLNILTADPNWGVTNAPTIGRGSGFKMNGDIAEIFITKKAATNAQRQQAQGYVKSFWGLTF